MPYTVLGSFYESNSIDSRLLDTASKNFPSYFEMTKRFGNDDRSYQLDVKSSQMLTMDHPVELNLIPGKGFIQDKESAEDSNENVA